MVFLALLGVLIGLTLFNAGGTAPESGTGTVVSPPKSVSARPMLAVTRISPLTVSGRGFKAGERIRITMNGTGRRQVVASRSGTFNLGMGGAGRCNGGTIVAVGSKGSRAVANFSQLLCVSP